MLSFFDLRASCLAIHALHGAQLGSGNLQISFSTPKDNMGDKDAHQGGAHSFLHLHYCLLKSLQLLSTKSPVDCHKVTAYSQGDYPPTDGCSQAARCSSAVQSLWGRQAHTDNQAKLMRSMKSMSMSMSPKALQAYSLYPCPCNHHLIHVSATATPIMSLQLPPQLSPLPQLFQQRTCHLGNINNQRQKSKANTFVAALQAL